MMKNITIKKIENKKAPIELLFLADPSVDSIKTYLKKGSCYVAYEGDGVVGAYVLLAKVPDTLEIMNIAVAEDKQGKGIGKMLVADAAKRAKRGGAKKLLVGTGNSSLGQLAFYQKCGFRMVKVKKDHFIKKYKKPIYENGIQCRDMIVLEINL